MDKLRNLTELDDITIAKSVTCDIVDLNKHINLSKNDLTIIQQNIRSIYRNFDNFEATFSDLISDIDVIILTECRLNSNKPLPILSNYSHFATTNNCNQNDGVVIYAKSKLNPIFKEHNLDNASCIQLNICGCTILGIYRSPSLQNASNFINTLNTLLDTIKCNQNIIICGDININLNIKDNETAYECSNRASYLNMLSLHGLLPGHTIPTRENSCLDHFILKIDKTKLSASIAVLNTTITDHASAFMNISKLKTNYRSPTIKTFVDFEEAAEKLVNKNLSNLLFSDDPDFVIEHLINKLKSSLDESVKTKKISSNQRIIKPWITSGILRCIRNRNRMQLKLRSDPHNAILKITFTRYRNFCNKLIKKQKRKYESELLKTNVKNPKVLWKTIKEIAHFNTAKTGSCELLSTHSSPIDSVNSVNSYFANVGKHLAENILSRPPHIIDNLISTPNSQLSSFVLLETDPSEVDSIISNLKSDSAPGWDGIQTKFIKMVKPLVVPIITHLANLCFRKGIFPTLLKKSIVTPVYKGGDKSDINNYRPISVLSVISKVIERLINSRLTAYLEKFYILSTSQFGFRKAKSTEDAISGLSSLVTHFLDRGEKCLTVFLDLKKAFDTVSIPILVKKMENIGIRGIPLKLLSDYLKGRS